MDSNKEPICTKTNDSAFLKHNHDTISEILIRVEPSDIFNCMLVSQYWLSVITTYDFWTNYLNRWKDSSSIIVGLLRCNTSSPEAQLLATSNVGRNINVKKLIPTGFFVSKSPTGGLLLFCGNYPNTFYVVKSAWVDPPVKLPPPPAYYKSCMANIICCCEDGDDYKVVLVCAESITSRPPVQIYCSWTGKWESSTLDCSICILLDACPIGSGTIVTGGGSDVIYWRAIRSRSQIDCLAAWDVKGGRISVIPAPPFMAPKKFCFEITYGVSPQPQGSLLAATYIIPRTDYVWESKWSTINIWTLDDDNKDWRFLYAVRHASIWTKNLSLLEQFFEARTEERFHFVSFVPGRSDSIFLGLKQHLFIYDFHTHKLKYVDYIKYGNSTIPSFDDGATYHPVTLLNLKIRPSSPSSLQLSHCSTSLL